jgi:hypothetical protein
VQLLPDAGLLPVAEATPTGHAGTEAKLLRKSLPGYSGREYEQDSVKHLAVVDPFATWMTMAPGSSRQQWLDQFPELVVYQNWWQRRPPILVVLFERIFAV